MLRSRSANVTLLAIVALVVALAVLASLQYRWINSLAEADARRMRGSVEFAAAHFADEFDREVTHTFIAFAEPNLDGSAEELAGRYDQWAAGTRDTRMIRALYFVPAGSTELQRLDLNGRRFVPEPWPASLSAVRERLRPSQQRPPEIQAVQPGVPALIVPCGEMRMFMKHAAGPGMMMRHLGMQGPRPLPPGAVAAVPVCPAFTIIELNRDYLARVLLPELTRRYFSNEFGGDYQVALRNAATGDVMYRSEESWPHGGEVRADVAVPIFRLFMFRVAGLGDPARDPPRGPSQWQLVARNRSGSLAGAVAAIRRRNLSVALAIVAVLGVSAATLMVMLRRAQRLQQQQLEFVAGITHELNTPLTAITSAGQNLADGIISDHEQVSRYGKIVLNEARRLSDMVGQVLDYAGIESGRRSARLELIDLRSVVAEAIEQCRWMAENAAMRIDADTARDLPRVRGDSAALTRAVQNLVANAISHGRDGGWVRVNCAADGGAVVITVEDGGHGVPARELKHLFEPFFRGSASTRTRGSGLGLTIVKEIVDAHGGSVTAANRHPGAIFTVRLPAAAQPVQAAETADQHA